MKKNLNPIILFACVTLDGSRPLGCNSAMAGVQAVGLIHFDSLNKVETTAAGVVALPAYMGAASIARFELKHTATKYLETGVSGGDNRSKGVKGTISMYLNEKAGEDLQLAKTVDQLQNGPVVMFYERKDGRIFVAGSQCGAEATNIVSDTGGQSGDFTGYQIDITTDEPDFSKMYLLTGAGLTAYASALMPNLP